MLAARGGPPRDQDCKRSYARHERISYAELAEHVGAQVAVVVALLQPRREARMDSRACCGNWKASWVMLQMRREWRECCEARVARVERTTSFALLGRSGFASAPHCTPQWLHTALEEDCTQHPRSERSFIPIEKRTRSSLLQRAANFCGGGGRGRIGGCGDRLVGAHCTPTGVYAARTELSP